MKLDQELLQVQSPDIRMQAGELRIVALTDGAFPGIPEKINTFEILFIKSGTGTISVDGRDYALSDNIFFCLAPGQYRCLHSNNDANGYRISFSLPFFLLADGQTNYYTREWMAPCTDALDELFSHMNQELTVQDHVSPEVVRSLFKVFMIYLRRESGSISDGLDAAGKDRLVIHRFFVLLQKNFVSKKLVADYADELCITPNYLNAIVKKQTGYPASHHIQQFIIVEAKRAAIYSGLRMKEVAQRLGFDDYAHFSKFFKNYSGVNFSDFRRSVVI